LVSRNRTINGLSGTQRQGVPLLLNVLYDIAALRFYQKKSRGFSVNLFYADQSKQQPANKNSV